MINIKYLSEMYTIKPLCVRADISAAAVQQALIQLNFELLREYILVCGKRDLAFVPAITQGVINFKLELQEEMPNSFYYVVCEETKTIIYSPGV